MSPYKVFLNNTVVNNRVGAWYIGVRQLSVDEVDQYSMSNPPPVPKPFTGRLTTNFTLLTYTASCYYSHVGDTTWSSDGCEVQVFTLHFAFPLIFVSVTKFVNLLNQKQSTVLPAMTAAR